MGLDGEGNGTPLQYSCLENPMDRGAWWAAIHGVAKSRTWLSNFTFNFRFSLSCIGEGNGNPLQYSCLENPRDGGAWWVVIYGVAQSWIRMKRLSSSRWDWMPWSLFSECWALTQLFHCPLSLSSNLWLLKTSKSVAVVVRWFNSPVRGITLKYLLG